MIKSAKQRRFLEATETARGYVPGSSAPKTTPELTSPGGLVRSGGYLANTKFKTLAMPRLRKGGM